MWSLWENVEQISTAHMWNLGLKQMGKNRVTSTYRVLLFWSRCREMTEKTVDLIEKLRDEVEKMK